MERQDADQNTSVVGNRKSQLLAPSRGSLGFSLLPTSCPTGTRTASFRWGAPRLSARVVDRRHGADQRLWSEEIGFGLEQSGSFFFVLRAAGQSPNPETRSNGHSAPSRNKERQPRKRPRTGLMLPRPADAQQSGGSTCCASSQRRPCPQTCNSPPSASFSTSTEPRCATPPS